MVAGVDPAAQRVEQAPTARVAAVPAVARDCPVRAALGTARSVVRGQRG